MKPYQLLLFLLTLILVPLTIIFFPHKSITAQSCAYHEEAYQNLNLTNLSQELETTGLLGEIHGAVSPSQLYVLSVREPKNFFNFRHFSIIPENNKVQQTLAQVKRHDQVCLTGKLINNPSPQPHLLVQSAKIIESWSGLESYEDYTYQAEIPQELKEEAENDALRMILHNPIEGCGASMPLWLSKTFSKAMLVKLNQLFNYTPLHQC